MYKELFSDYKKQSEAQDKYEHYAVLKELIFLGTGKDQSSDCDTNLGKIEMYLTDVCEQHGHDSSSEFIANSEGGALVALVLYRVTEMIMKDRRYLKDVDIEEFKTKFQEVMSEYASN